jgi:hypothetical protein
MYEKPQRYDTERADRPWRQEEPAPRSRHHRAVQRAARLESLRAAVQAAFNDSDAVDAREARGQDVHRIAASGVRGSSGPLPHLDRIRASFGRHDLTCVAAHTGAGAESAARDLGARAYAYGSQVAFGEAPNLHMVAHEAAHVVQQRGGVQLQDGVGQVGDRYELHADAVADAVVRRESAEPILDQMAGRSTAGESGAAVQRDAPEGAGPP